MLALLNIESFYSECMYSLQNWHSIFLGRIPTKRFFAWVWIPTCFWLLHCPICDKSCSEKILSWNIMRMYFLYDIFMFRKVIKKKCFPNFSNFDHDKLHSRLFCKEILRQCSLLSRVVDFSDYFYLHRPSLKMSKSNLRSLVSNFT